MLQDPLLEHCALDLGATEHCWKIVDKYDVLGNLMIR